MRESKRDQLSGELETLRNRLRKRQKNSSLVVDASNWCTLWTCVQCVVDALCGYLQGMIRSVDALIGCF